MGICLPRKEPCFGRSLPVSLKGVATFMFYITFQLLYISAFCFQLFGRQLKQQKPRGSIIFSYTIILDYYLRNQMHSPNFYQMQRSRPSLGFSIHGWQRELQYQTHGLYLTFYLKIDGYYSTHRASQPPQHPLYPEPWN